MIYLAYFTFGFVLLQLLVAIVNLVFSQPFPKRTTEFAGLVSVLIPARNEEKNISNILSDLIRQDYRNIEIIVFNDQSTDKTEQIVNEYSKLDHRIKLTNSDGLPKGWLGKNYACHSLSKVARGEYFLFLDADVRISNDIIINTITFSERYKLGLLSIFPKQIMSTFGERITVPNMNYILLSLLPLVLVRKSSFQSLAAANGQFMLFNSKKYNELLPHEKMRSSKVEDIEIARYYKQSKIPVACLTGNETITCRMYEGFSESVNGFSKNVITFFGNSFTVAILFWFVTTLGFFAVLFGFNLFAFFLYILAILITRNIISFISKQNMILNLVLLIPQQITLGLFIYQAFMNKLNKQHQWKGRNISS